MQNFWKSLVAIVLVTAACNQETDPISVTHSGGNRPGEFKGYDFVNDFVKFRFLQAENGSNRYFEMSKYFGEMYPQDGGLNSLLGRFSGNAGGNDFRNGTPNSINMLLWYIAGKSFGNQFSAVCTTRNPTLTPENLMTGNYMTLEDNVFAAVLSLCSEPRDSQKFKEALEALWIATAGYDLPEAEMRAFIAAFSSGDLFADLAPSDLVAAAVGSIILNPYLILEN